MWCPQISLDLRLSGHPNERKTLTVDCTDCPILEPSPFSDRWFSYKFHGAALRYEVSISTASGEICSIVGPLPPGAFNDAAIFNLFLQGFLEARGEIAICDRGYRFIPINVACWPIGNEPVDEHWNNSDLRAKQETANKRLKQFNVLKRVYRHDINTHGTCFRAVAAVTQLALQNGEPLFATNF